MHTARINGTSQILCPSDHLCYHFISGAGLIAVVDLMEQPFPFDIRQIIALSLKSLRDTSAAVHISDPVFAAVHEQRRYVRSTPVIFCSTILISETLVKSVNGAQS